ncbi:predicted protein [Chaetomium globosum CBS 148.51]|uniref:Uncharacterized protein n=1 Tax=Chaetomium globosum (strain ATCC 6205 / CBS 148.51 / DSM 1962 / NBRC 6347 / NRRL 1970) TaxID=306901 RepID=Q2HIE4_CHAGB|nr:uncharacterized protein CHGG_00010 [Chaetomium globosum CBS 148.51]EAQ91775.1 predicted protein [Chaetomium globosum CBS 148.51]
MASLHLVPIPIAVTLIVLTVAIIPLTPVLWVWITATNISRSIHQGQKPAQTAKRIGRWIGLSIILPWAAILVLWLMIVAQILLTPLFFLHQLRDLRETITWLFDYLDFAHGLDNPPTPASNTTPIDIASIPLYTFTPLPSTSPTTIRLLTIHPDSPNAPLRGIVTTTTLSSAPNYDVLSYTRVATITPTHNNPTPDSTSTLLLIKTTTTDPPTAPTWTRHPLPAPLRPPPSAACDTPHNPRRVWVDAVSVNSARHGPRNRRQVAVMGRDLLWSAAG